MPVVDVWSPVADPPDGLLEELANVGAEAFRIDVSSVWVVWHDLDPRRAWRPAWAAGSRAPLVFVRCKITHSIEKVEAFLRAARDVLAGSMGCASEDLYIAVQRVQPRELLVDGDIWVGPTASGSGDEILVRPVGRVRAPRQDLEDDYWGGVVSVIELDDRQFGSDSVQGLGAFSHIEVLFHMGLVPPDAVVVGARHPRGRRDLPSVGIFAQRAKARPNRLAVSRCRLLSIEGLRLEVEGLDAVNGTAVIDIKPWMAELGPAGPVTQPPWSHEITARYFAPFESSPHGTPLEGAR